MSFWCSICQKPIEDGNVIFICRGHANEPAPDEHERLRAMHENCARNYTRIMLLTVKYPVYITRNGELVEE